MSFLHTRNEKIFQSILGIIVMVFILNIDKFTVFMESKKSFEGKIIRKELTRKNSQLIYIYENSKAVFYDIRNINIFKMIDTGDYIIKKKGTIDYLLIKNNDTIVFNLKKLNIFF